MSLADSLGLVPSGHARFVPGSSELPLASVLALAHLSPLLEISELKRFFLSAGFELVGSGASRVVFTLPDSTWVVKVAHAGELENPEGDNLNEARVWKSLVLDGGPAKRHFAPVLDYSACGTVLFQTRIHGKAPRTLKPFLTLLLELLEPLSLFPYDVSKANLIVPSTGPFKVVDYAAYELF